MMVKLDRGRAGGIGGEEEGWAGKGRMGGGIEGYVERCKEGKWDVIVGLGE